MSAPRSKTALLAERDSVAAATGGAIGAGSARNTACSLAQPLSILVADVHSIRCPDCVRRWLETLSHNISVRAAKGPVQHSSRSADGARSDEPSTDRCSENRTAEGGNIIARFRASPDSARASEECDEHDHGNHQDSDRGRSRYFRESHGHSFQDTGFE